jgi:hypothetical protein
MAMVGRASLRWPHGFIPTGDLDGDSVLSFVDGLQTGCEQRHVCALLDWQREIRISASAVVIAFGVFRFVNRRHPRALARIRPTQLALWSFTIATAHGAGLMLLPIYLGLCSSEDDKVHRASAILMAENSTTAILVSLLHTISMVTAGGVIALLVHDRLGLKFLSRSWFNLDLVWAMSLILIGAIGLLTA